MTVATSDNNFIVLWTTVVLLSFVTFVRLERRVKFQEKKLAKQSEHFK